MGTNFHLTYHSKFGRIIYAVEVASIVFVLAGVAEWQTHTTQNRTGNRVGSTPTSGTKKLILSGFCDLSMITQSRFFIVNRG